MRTFVRSLNLRCFKPTIYCSDRIPLVDGKGENLVKTHEYGFIRYIAAAVRRVLIPDLTFLPGYELYSWGIGAKQRILKDIKNGEEFDYIHSISFPCACHKVALEVKKKTGLPWIAQFYDPWADNPYRRFKTKYFKSIDWKQEKECVENADLIIHDNQSIADVWKLRYGEELAKKIVVLPLTIPIPEAKISPNNHKSGDVLTISHIGDFMLNRTSLPFINAVNRLIKEHPSFRNQIRINYIGKVTEEERRLIDNENLSDVFSLTGTISSAACVEYYKHSDIFLAVDGVNTKNLFFPSKLLKYYYFQRPILGITPKNSVLDYEMRFSHNTSIENSDVEGIVNYLLKALKNYESLLVFDSNYWHKYTPDYVVSHYEQIVVGNIVH